MLGRELASRRVNCIQVDSDRINGACGIVVMKKPGVVKHDETGAPTSSGIVHTPYRRRRKEAPGGLPHRPCHISPIWAITPGGARPGLNNGRASTLCPVLLSLVFTTLFILFSLF